MIRPLRFNTDIHTAPLDTAYEVLWTSHMPLVAAAKTGKVHLTTRESYPRTLCGLMIPRASMRFDPNERDDRCIRCTKKWRKTT